MGILMKLDNFTGTEPKLLLEEYFAGNCKAWGVFEGLSGSIKRQFEVDICGKWNGEERILDEDFKFSDGTVDHRHWRIKKLDQDSYEGVTDGVIGTARGRICGQAFQWQYRFRLRVGKRYINVKFNDWMFLQQDGVLINRASVKKFGIVVGRVWLFFKHK